jgi:serine-type D-Ala-D-Ala carboxypeptidase/endopeptidase
MRIFRKRILILCTLSLLSFKSSKPSKKMEDEVEELARQFLQNRNNYGLAIGIVYKDSDYKMCFGKTSTKNSHAVDTGSVFEIGSITKVFTSVVLADEVVKGNMKLNESFVSYLPKPVNRPELSSIQLRHLASHSSGLPRLATNFWPTVTDQGDPYKDYSEQHLYSFLSDYRPERKPESGYEYSNVAMGLLGNILSSRNHCTYEELIQKRICEPFHMSQTHVRVTPEQMPRIAEGHSNGQPVRNWDFLDATAGQGALKSTVTDMVKFTRYSLYPEQSELGKAILMTQEEHYFDVRSRRRVGLGWHIGRFGEEKYLEHNGATGGYRSFIGLIPDSKIGVVILSNSDNSVDNLGIQILEVLKNRQLAEKLMMTSSKQQE